jgi:hypothetical protein
VAQVSTVRPRTQTHFVKFHLEHTFQIRFVFGSNSLLSVASLNCTTLRIKPVTFVYSSMCIISCERIINSNCRMLQLISALTCSPPAGAASSSCASSSQSNRRRAADASAHACKHMTDLFCNRIHAILELRVSPLLLPSPRISAQWPNQSSQALGLLLLLNALLLCPGCFNKCAICAHMFVF